MLLLHFFSKMIKIKHKQLLQHNLNTQLLTVKNKKTEHHVYEATTGHLTDPLKKLH